jgi:DsbC/DsbD-like thiol-disulfide interchange protein
VERAPVADQPETKARTRATLSLISELDAFVPGSTATLGVHFKIAPKWHLYWDGLNDTGYAPTFDLTLPPGMAKAGNPQWPTPHRHVSSGDILDHIYENAVTILIPVKVPQDASPGTTLTVTLRSEWLVCEEACVPEEGVATLTLPVAKEAKPVAANLAAFRDARARIPAPLESAKDRVRVTQSAGVIEFTAPGASGLSFYPTPDCIPPRDLLHEGDAKGEHLKLSLDAAPDKSVRGVLEVRGKTPQESSFYLVDRVAQRE